jgi:hypothetical protein
MAPPFGTFPKLDEMIRPSLVAGRAAFHSLFLWATGMVVVGIIFEGWEIAKELREDFGRHRTTRPRLVSITQEGVPVFARHHNWAKFVGAFGWLLVVVGVAGEYGFDLELADFDRGISLIDAEAFTYARAETVDANVEAALARKEAAIADAHTLREIDERVALERDFLWHGSRDVLIRLNEARITKALRKFNVQRFKMSICWPDIASGDSGTPFPPVNGEVMLTQQAIRLALSKAGWRVVEHPYFIGPMPITIPCSGSGIWVAVRNNVPNETRGAAITLQSAINRALRQNMPFGVMPHDGIDRIGIAFPTDGIEIHVGLHPVVPGNPESTVPQAR